MIEGLATILGGLLAAGAGWFVQNRIEASRIDRQRQLMLQGIDDDLSNSIELYDQLAADWERSKIVWFNLLTELGDSRHTYVNNRDFMLLVRDKDLRNRIVRYYRKSGHHLLSLQNAQQRKYDIEARYTQAVQQYLLANPDLQEEQVREVVARSMDKESQELTYWNEQLPTLVAGLERFKSEARELLREIKKA